MSSESSLVFSNVSLCVPKLSSGMSTYSSILISSEVSHTKGENNVLIRVERFGFSTNNITYQALGEIPHFRYFDFHQVPETQQVSSKSLGLIPVWGFGTVLWSSNKKIQAGERVYGYFAPTRYLLLPIVPNDVNRHSFYVARPHLPRDRRPYNQIIRCESDPQYNPSADLEDLTMLYRPLFWTSFWCEDWLSASGFRGGTSNFLISSASSKTAFCLAYLLRRRFSREGKTDLNLVGLTSSKNVEFTQSLELYDTISGYGELKALVPAIESRRWIYVDVAGNEELNQEIRILFSTLKSTSLSAQISLGLTNIKPDSTQTSLSSWAKNTHLVDAATQRSNLGSTHIPKSENFFMPEWLAVRRTQLSIPQITKMQNDAWSDLLKEGRTWVQLERISGPFNVQKKYDEVVKNGLGPDKGYIWSLWDESLLNSNKPAVITKL